MSQSKTNAQNDNDNEPDMFSSPSSPSAQASRRQPTDALIQQDLANIQMWIEQGRSDQWIANSINANNALRHSNAVLAILPAEPGTWAEPELPETIEAADIAALRQRAQAQVQPPPRANANANANTRQTQRSTQGNSQASTRLIPLPSNFSDGVLGQTTKADFTEIHQPAEFLKNITELWQISQGQTVTNERFTQLPANYRYFELHRPAGGRSHHDRIIYGHPSGTYRTPQEYAKHFNYTMANGTADGCDCKNCSK